MEATGVYHELAAQTLFDAGVTVSIINLAQAKDFARGLAVRTKTDGVDSLVLARLGALLKPNAWQPLPRRCVSYKPCWRAGRPSLRTCAANTIDRKRP